MLRSVFYIFTFTFIVFALILIVSKPDIIIIDKPIKFTKEREKLSIEYMKNHYDLNVTSTSIEPKMIVLHWTGDSNLSRSYGYFYEEHIPSDWGKVSKASALNVSAHFLVDREGNIFRLMPETQFARHVIGLNYTAIGIENVGGDNQQGNLTSKQLSSNIKLVRYLKEKYPKITYLIAHKDYTNFTQSNLWLEKNNTYRTVKYDVDEKFITTVYKYTKELGLKRTP